MAGFVPEISLSLSFSLWVQRGVLIVWTRSQHPLCCFRYSMTAYGTEVHQVQPITTAALDLATQP